MRRLSTSLLLLAVFSPLAAGPQVILGRFTQSELERWQTHSFSGKTAYRLIPADDSPTMTLQAHCDGGASALYLEQPVDLAQTPILRWQWRVEGVHRALDGTTKAGDDYAARVYVVYRISAWLPWRTYAVNYVWANTQPKGRTWPNAFTDQAMMVALASGVPQDADRWRSEARDVRADFSKLLDMDIEAIDGVALMTDCDNGQGRATAYYRCLRFTGPDDSINEPACP